MSTVDVDHLRQVIENTLSDLGMPNAHWSCVTEVPGEEGRDNPQWPRRGVLAVLLHDRSAIEFRGETGDLLATVGLDGIDAEQRLLASAAP
jgi:hypothetical protein